MKQLAQSLSLAERAYQVVLDEICEGTLGPGSHLVQEQIAKRLGVSRQPIQQAMALLKADGLVRNAPGRGLVVIPLEPELMASRYQIRAALDGLAADLAAKRVRESSELCTCARRRGQAILRSGIAAVEKNAIKRMIRWDMEFHNFLYECSGNALIAPACEPHWRHLRRIMGEVLRKVATPENIWQQHQRILDAVLAGDRGRAKAVAIEHVDQAASGLARTLSLRGS